MEEEWKPAGAKAPSWGARRAVLSELAPAATFVAANYNLPLVDPATGTPWKRVKFRPVLINYSVGDSTYERSPNDQDLKRLADIRKMPLPPGVPTAPFPIGKMYHGTRLAPKGFTHVHQLFLPRPAQALAALWRRVAAHPNPRIRNMLLFFLEQALWTGSVLNRYRPTGYSQVNQYLTGVYYVPSQHSECSPWYMLEGKLSRLVKAFEGYMINERNGCTATTSSTVSLGLPENCIDYIFTDPPFGENIYYADLNFLVESWHRVRTDAGPEAIVDQAKGKDLRDYQELMRRCLVEFYRVLKPGRWMTMVFHQGAVLDWLRYMGVVEELNTTDRGKLGHELKVTTEGVDTPHDLTHVGVGVSQVLPIVVMSLLANTDTTLIFEQPELHLHPRVQTLLGDFFLSIALLGKQCIVETHSECLINRLRFRVAAAQSEALEPNIKMYFVEKVGDGSSFRPVVVNRYGAIQDWPEGFFDQSQGESEEILKAAMIKKKQERGGRGSA